MSRFAGKSILITGGTSGIGLAGALRIASEGGRLCITGVTTGRISEAQRRLPLETIVLENDAAEPGHVAALVEAAQEMGGLDGLWLNAGYMQLSSPEAVDEGFFDAMISVNLRGPVLQIAALMEYLKPGCSVLFTAATADLADDGAATTYLASKAALMAVTRSYAHALGGRRVRVNTIAPGPIDTSFRQFLPAEFRQSVEVRIRDRMPLARWGTPEEAAAVALFLLSDDASFVTGSHYAVDGGLSPQ